jgi:hypothetical protein
MNGRRGTAEAVLASAAFDVGSLRACLGATPRQDAVVAGSLVDVCVNPPVLDYRSKKCYKELIGQGTQPVLNLIPVLLSPADTWFDSKLWDGDPYCLRGGAGL